MKKKSNYIIEDQDLNKVSMASDLVSAYQPNQITPLRKILGGKYPQQHVESEQSLIDLARNGLSKETLYALAKYLGITLDEMAQLLHTSYRNLARKGDDDLLDTHKSETILELASLAQRGVEVIGSHEGFKQWIRTHLVVLGGKTPLDYLDTTFGIKWLLKILGRIEQGVYS